MGIRSFIGNLVLMFFLPTDVIFMIFSYISQFGVYVTALAVLLGFAFDVFWGYGLFFTFYAMWLWLISFYHVRLPSIMWKRVFAVVWIAILIFRSMPVWYIFGAVISFVMEVLMYEEAKRLVY